MSKSSKFSVGQKVWLAYTDGAGNGECYGTGSGPLVVKSIDGAWMMFEGNPFDYQCGIVFATEKEAVQSAIAENILMIARINYIVSQQEKRLKELNDEQK